jgi:hypothetical protein
VFPAVASRREESLSYGCGFDVGGWPFAADDFRVQTDREPANAVRHSADTVVTKREMRDTGIIRHDTTFSSDTIHKRGTRPVKTDTLKKP